MCSFFHHLVSDFRNEITQTETLTTIHYTFVTIDTIGAVTVMVEAHESKCFLHMQITFLNTNT